jgi:hypothetical protein
VNDDNKKQWLEIRRGLGQFDEMMDGGGRSKDSGEPGWIEPEKCDQNHVSKRDRFKSHQPSSMLRRYWHQKGIAQFTLIEMFITTSRCSSHSLMHLL